jgi:hypothetical protein
MIGWVILRCTKKVLAVVGGGRVTEPGPAPDAEDWYANLLGLTGASAYCSLTPPPCSRSSRQMCARRICARPAV